MHKWRRVRLINLCVALSLLGSASSLAQTVANNTSSSTGSNSPALEEIVVTGTRLHQADAQSVSPVVTVGHEELEDRGTVRIEDMLNTLPQVAADQGSAIGNRATGTATVNLRGLGSNRTLVLIDGRRLMPGDPTAPGNLPDLNSIPVALVDHVDVLTGGASAVYGSDAVAGVVNFVTLKNFEGLRIDAQGGINQHDNNDRYLQSLIAPLASANPSQYQVPTGSVADGASYNLSLTWGINSDAGDANLTAYATYRRVNAVAQSSRDYSACPLNSGTTFRCGGSSVNATGRFLVYSDPSLAQLLGDYSVDRATGNTFHDFGNSDLFNLAPYNNLQRPDTTVTFGVSGHKQYTDALDLYTQLMFMDDRTTVSLSPSALFGDLETISCANPYLSAQEQSALCVDGRDTPVTSAAAIVFRRNVEGGGRIEDFRHTSYRAVVGARGALGGGWSYDVYAQYGSAVFQEAFLNDFSSSRVALALDAAADPATGQIACRAALSGSNPNCVPYNLFNLNGVTQGALNYMEVPAYLSGYTQETVVNGSVTGNLGQYGVKSPWAGTGLGVVLGSEYRREQLTLRSDEEFSSGDLASYANGIPGQTGGYTVGEVFSELRLPLVEQASWAKQLAVEAGYRRSHYDLFDTNTDKFGVTWAPTADVSFRASYERAVRAPNIYELFSPSSVALDGVTDPCAGANPLASNPNATAANCARTGVLPGQYGQILPNPASTYNGLVGGNAHLSPEKSNSYTVGLVLTPRIAPDLSIGVDWFDIKVDNAIGTIGADTALDRCLTTGDAFYCSKIHRSPGTGSLWLQPNGYVEDTNFNLGSIEVEGVDFDASYRMDLANIGLGQHGSLAFHFVGTYTDKFRTLALPGDTSANDCAGFYGALCGQPNPTWRHKVSATWTSPWNFATTITWRRIGAVRLGEASDPATEPATDARLPAVNYMDLSGSYRWKDLQFRLGVNNVLDRQPPLIGAADLPVGPGNGNTFPQIYDSLGRFFFLGLTATL